MPSLRIACLFLITVCVSTPATAGLLNKKCESSCRQQRNTCQSCRSSVKREAVKKTCFEIECKRICVPKVVLPWQRPGGWCLFGKKKPCAARCTTNCVECANGGCCRSPRGATLRTVRVLKKKSINAGEKCVYKWTPAGGGACANGACAR